MVLNPTRGRRILELLFTCADYLSQQLEVCPVTGDDTLDMEEAMGVFSKVWGPGGRRDLVDGLVRGNPIGLTRSELGIVSQWREGVYGRFTVHAEGTDVYYLAGDFAIEVRGPIQEADRLDGRPLTYVEALLLPCDGAIIYGGWVKDLSGTAAEARHGHGRTAFAEALRKGHVVRTGRQFIESAHAIREVVGQVGLGEGDGRATRADAPTHVGVLAGLSWEERETYISHDLKGEVRDLCRSLLRDKIDDFVVRGRPTTSLAEIMGRLRKDELQAICDTTDVRYKRNMKKAELVELALDSIPMDCDELWFHMVFMGADRVRGMQALIEAKGRIDVAADDVDGFIRLPFDTFPLVVLFRSGKGCAVVVSDEVRHVMAAGNVGYYERRAEGFDRACRYALISAQFRGVVPLMELAQDCVDLLEVKEDPEDIAMAIAMRIDLLGLGMDVVEIDHEPHLVSGGLVYYENTHELGEWETMFAHELLDRHEEVAPKPLGRLVTAHGYKDWMDYLYDQRATRELARYLDAHVPAHQSDVGFAEQLIEDLSMLLAMNDPDGYDRRRVFDLLEEFGLPVPDEDRGLVEGLVDAFVEVVPNWYANGWPIMGRRLQLV